MLILTTALSVTFMSENFLHKPWLHFQDGQTTFVSKGYAMQ